MGRYLDVSVQPARKVRGEKIMCENKSSTVLYVTVRGFVLS